jgi:uncharacterized protein DUF4169
MASMMRLEMGDLVNLKKFKKRVARGRSEQQAATNRARFGRTHLERARDEARDSRANYLLDQHRIEGEDAT